MLRLKFERTTRQISQQQLAAAARLQQTDISQIERGNLRPTKAQLRRLAHALRVEPDSLLTDVSVPEHSK